MILRPPISTRTDTLFPYTTLFRSLPARIPRNFPKPQRFKRPGDSAAHIKLVKKLPCCLCPRQADDPHHLMRSIDNVPKGTGRRHEDRWSLPVCRPCHNAIHRHGNDEVYLASRGLDGRSEERRVGKECVSTCRSRWAPYP